ncbi:MAG: hypothetical protein AABP62_05850 [Planctomycetota bacterium]
MAVDLPSETRIGDPAGRSFRWRLIPATFFLVMGPALSLGSVLIPLTAVYIIIQDGWADPRLPPLLRPTLTSWSFWQLNFWTGVIAAGSGLAWLRGRWRIAWGMTALVVVVVVLRSVLFPLN